MRISCTTSPSPFRTPGFHSTLWPAPRVRGWFHAVNQVWCLISPPHLNVFKLWAAVLHATMQAKAVSKQPVTPKLLPSLLCINLTAETVHAQIR